MIKIGVLLLRAIEKAGFGEAIAILLNLEGIGE